MSCPEISQLPRDTKQVHEGEKWGENTLVSRLPLMDPVNYETLTEVLDKARAAISREACMWIRFVHKSRPLSEQISLAVQSNSRPVLRSSKPAKIDKF